MWSLFQNKKILTVAAHPDDELLGLGGTIYRATKAYDAEAWALVLGEGLTSRQHSRDTEAQAEELDIHHQNFQAACATVGYSKAIGRSFADNRFDSHDLLDIVKAVEEVKAECQPDIVFYHHQGDTNIDHEYTARAVTAAFRPVPGQKPVTLISFHTPSSTEWQHPGVAPAFQPNIYAVLTAEDLETKQKAMECYQYEKRDYPHPRSSKALEIIAQYHGLTVGERYAEAFMLVRQHIS